MTFWLIFLAVFVITVIACDPGDFNKEHDSWRDD